MYFPIWVVLGALIGALAASRKGFSVLAGVLGGALLGPFALLMFFVSGVSRADAERVHCPHCDEKISPRAKVCPNCQREVAPAEPQPTTGAYKAKGA